MLQVKLPDVDRIHPQSNTFAMGVENKAKGGSKLNDSPGYYNYNNSEYHDKFQINRSKMN